MTNTGDLDKIVLKNSIKWNLLLLFGSLTLSIYLLSKNVSSQTISWSTIIFCLIIVFYPLIKLINRRPKLTITKNGLIFKNGEFRPWLEIESIEVEEVNDDLPSHKLKIQILNGKTINIKLTDLNYTKDNIIEFIKTHKNAY